MSGAPEARFRFKPFPGSSHAWALGELAGLPRPLRLLDVGAGAGHVSQAALAQGGIQVAAAVEHDPDRRQALEAAGLPAVSDLVDVPRHGGAARGADVALVLDVIEHVADPVGLLQDVQDRLRPGGLLLISVPNVAHWSVRVGLLAGRWDYAERGILDRTHLRFFTHKTFGEALEQAGLEVEQRCATVAPFELILPEAVHGSRAWAVTRTARRYLANAVPGVLAYQLLARARKPLA